MRLGFFGSSLRLRVKRVYTILDLGFRVRGLGFSGLRFGLKNGVDVAPGPQVVVGALDDAWVSSVTPTVSKATPIQCRWPTCLDT